MYKRPASGWAFLHFYYKDKSNACLHEGQVRYSPITFALYSEIVGSGSFSYTEYSQIDEVLTDALRELRTHQEQQYELDMGR